MSANSRVLYIFVVTVGLHFSQIQLLPPATVLFFLLFRALDVEHSSSVQLRTTHDDNDNTPEFTEHFGEVEEAASLQHKPEY